ncbi:MAG: nitroreductase/quinone reductase family protein [Thermoleophilaceae bacterium]
MSLAARFTNSSSRLFPRSSRRWSRLHAQLYRRTGGRFMPKWFGAPVLVLETVGRKSGEPRVTPLVYARDGDDLVVSPAAGGTTPNPAWWLNLQAAGSGVAVIGGERRTVRPRVTAGAEREQLWPKLCEAYPPALDYVRMMGRELTVVVLERIA